MQYNIQPCLGGELWEQLCQVGYYCEANAAHFIKQLLEAIEHLHSLNICHRDIKPENLLLSDKITRFPRLLLADFGLADTINPKRSEEFLLKAVCGTAGYMAPEVLLGTGYEGTAADIWSVGMVGYFLVITKSLSEERVVFRGKKKTFELTNKKKLFINFFFFF